MTEKAGISKAADREPGLLAGLVGNGRPLLTFTGLSLILFGGFALFLAATGHFLPHDARFLGMSAAELCAIQDCRILRFMIHDRVAFGGSLIAIGVLYLWLAEFPLRRGEAWAWWVFVITGLLGFGSILAYLGYGYLDIWHGVATLTLLPIFALGLSPTDLDAINSRLIPLIAHDRAGFGGAILTTGMAAFFAVWCARPSRSLWQALLLAGGSGFAAAIGIHPIVSYNDLVHLAPAILGAVIFAVGLILTRPTAVSAPAGN